MKTTTTMGAVKSRAVAIATVLALAITLGWMVGPVEQATAAVSSTAVWVGSPTHAAWPATDGCSGARYPSHDCSLPFAHHTYYYGDPYRGDWGVDLRSVPNGQRVRLYAAPNDTRLNKQINARVARVVPACGQAYVGESTTSRLQRGGWAVVIELRHGPNIIGTVKYVHVEPSVRSGQTIPRWGTEIGRVGSYTWNGCWQGVHLHMEMTNWRNYSCYNRGWRPGQPVNETNFLGFVGGAYARSGQQACP